MEVTYIGIYTQALPSENRRGAPNCAPLTDVFWGEAF
jgi:hypothetical protein